MALPIPPEAPVTMAALIISFLSHIFFKAIITYRFYKFKFLREKIRNSVFITVL